MTLWSCWNQTYFIFSTFTMSEYFFHNTDENLKNRGEFAKPFFGPRMWCQPLKVQKTHDLQKLTSFNYIPNGFQNIYYLIFDITILRCCGNNPMKSVFWEKNAKFGKIFFSFSTILHNTNRNLKNKAELPKQCFYHKIRFRPRKLQKNGTFRTGLHLALS